MGVQLVQDILDILFAGLTDAATSIPTALGSAITNFMTVTTGEGASAVTRLSDQGQILVTFMGVSLALSLVYLGVNVIFSFGHNR